MKNLKLKFKTRSKVTNLCCKLRLTAQDTLQLICLLNAASSPMIFPTGEILAFNNRDSDSYKFLIGNGFIFPVGTELSMRDASGEEVTLDEFVKQYNAC
ncbi:hypothetical protein K4L44_05920 [Halosquirtibacter laminarini]|uniref:Uncharacterized protein n=1 Tax=Halosquirtibacter laminarini TaxID=3374600 RepID=A0AC61NR98_9BACT|nr:hypothetical protein K4L44_05920 [Prolixibacteraceae bacterium]